MMAHDSRRTPEPRPLSDETLTALRAAVLQLWQDRDATDDQLRSALDAMAREARARALRAEEVIVSLKSLLAELPELQAGPRRIEATRFQERLVTLCIKAYYRPSP
jgi:hypothetical protein